MFQLHAFDAGTPVEEVLSTLDDLVRAGKLRYVGVSNFAGWQLMKSVAVADRYGYPRYVAHQVYYSLVGRDYEWELLPLGLDQGIGALVWSPLGWGRLTGKLRRGRPLPAQSRLHQTAEHGPPVPDEYLFDVVEALDEVAKEVERTIPQVALNWLLRRPTVSSVIIGARNGAQLRDNLGAIGWTLTPEQLAKLGELTVSQVTGWPAGTQALAADQRRLRTCPSELVRQSGAAPDGVRCVRFVVDLDWGGTLEGIGSGGRLRRLARVRGGVTARG